jgi:hypothetical protein
MRLQHGGFPCCFDVLDPPALDPPADLVPEDIVILPEGERLRVRPFVVPVCRRVISEPPR